VSYEPRKEMFVKMVLASSSALSRPLYTMHWHYPRMLLPEANTHRMLSKNTRSSRAVPVKTMLAEVRDKPFIPWHWTKNQGGMQGVGGHDAPVCIQSIWDETEDHVVSREAAWLSARDAALEHAEAFMKAEYHKQVANRLIEPFAWTDTLITGTDFANFIHLRDHKDAEPHFRDLAQMVKEAIRDAEVQVLEPGEWHLPYITKEDEARVYEQKLDLELNCEAIEILQKVSAARNARISYAPFDGNPSFERELERYDTLVKTETVHASPLEHIATPDTQSHYEMLLIERDGDDDTILFSEQDWDRPELHGNLDGWIQYRKTVPNEAIHG
jgi:hypothetical protein